MPNQINIYHSDPVTHEYIGASVADIDPIDGTPLVPAFATLSAPMKTIAKGNVAVIDIANDKWTQVIDHRGTVYDTATGQPEPWMELGALPSGKTPLAPSGVNDSWDASSGAWVFDIAKAQDARAIQIKSDYQAALDAGVTYKAALFQSDAKSIATLTEVLTAIANGWTLPAGFAWIDAVNKPHPADITFLKGLSTALANHKAALFARLQIAKQGIAIAKTKAAVNKIVF